MHSLATAAATFSSVSQVPVHSSPPRSYPSGWLTSAETRQSNLKLVYRQSSYYQVAENIHCRLYSNSTTLFSLVVSLMDENH